MNSPVRSFGGIAPALVTPFDEQRRLAPDRARPLLDFLLQAGVHGLYVGGSTGEGFLQSVEERADYLRWVAEVVQGKVQLIAHVGALSTIDAVRLARIAADAGYDAVAATPPFYYAFTKAEIGGHYQAIAEASDLPCFLYNIPGTTGVRLTAEDLIRLMEIPRVVGVKYTATDFHSFERLKSARPDAVVYNGPDEMLTAGLAMGADGGIGSTYNVMPKRYLAIFEAVKRGDLEAARAEQARANAVIQTIIDVSPGVIPAVKALLAILGLDCGPSRQPFAALSPEAMRRLEACAVEHLNR